MKKGFTLIELLIVISIIAILSTIAITAFRGVQAKARDGARKADLNTLATALETYAQANNSYVLPANANPESCTRDTPSFYTTIDDFMSNNIVPKDPLTNNQYCYISINNGSSYRLFAKLENCSGTLCTYTNYNYSVTSDDLTLIPAPGDTTTAPSPTPTASPTPTVTPTPTTSPLCADGTNDKVYASNMVGCNGTVTFADSSLCAAGTHVCSVAEYVSRGGNSAINPNDKNRYLSSTLSDITWCDASTRPVLVPGGSSKIAACFSATYKYYYDSVNCGTANPGWYCNASGTWDGVVCCN